MGMLDWLLGVYLAKKAHNAVSRPTVTSREGKCDVIGMEPAGMSAWTIYFRKRGTNTGFRSSFVAKRSASTWHSNDDTFDIFWPGQ